jgi:hypothetical protein
MLPVFFQTSKNFLVGQTRRITAQGHNKIDSGQGMLMLPKAFSNQALDAVTGHRSLNMFARNGQAKPRKRSPVILPENHKIIITGTPSRGKYAFKVPALGQTLRTGETPGG